MIDRLKGLWTDERGATVIEYGLICSLIVLAVISAIVGVADATIDMWDNVAGEVTRAH